MPGNAKNNTSTTYAKFIFVFFSTRVRPDPAPLDICDNRTDTFRMGCHHGAASARIGAFTH